MRNQVGAEQFFSTLFPEINAHYLEIRKLPDVQQEWCQSIEEAVKASQDRKRNVYFGVALRSERKGDEVHAALLPALWADVDLKEFGGDERQAAERIAAFPFPPSIIVRSGNGFHIYWLFKELEKITLENRPYLRGVLLGLAETLNGDRACCDLARIMRVPGTLHAKRDGETVRVRDCPNPKPVRVLRWYPERRYNPCDFEVWCVEGPDASIKRSAKCH